MALLGEGGRLRLKREQPDPTVVGVASASLDNSYQLGDTYVWPGDLVELTALNGLPFIVSGSQTGNPGGHGIWSNVPWTYAPGYESIASGDAFWNNAPAFPWADAFPAVISQTVYAGVDQFLRVRFYANFTDAVNNNTGAALPVGSVDFGEFTITHLDANWLFACDIKNWNLELDAPSVDTSRLGRRFGESVKSLVTGGGDVDFFAEKRNAQDTTDPTALLRLLLLTERGCKASAEFWVLHDRQSSPCNGLAPGDIYYQCDLLVTNTSVNVVPEEMIGGSARFVTTGEIRLMLGT
jgi:hypothetical protein